MKMTDRLKELVAQLPKGLRSDWKNTNHFELTTEVPGDYWWLNLSNMGELNCDTELGKCVGLLMDIAEELVKIRDEVIIE
jgi:hypothetical protein